MICEDDARRADGDAGAIHVLLHVTAAGRVDDDNAHAIAMASMTFVRSFFCCCVSRMPADFSRSGWSASGTGSLFDPGQRVFWNWTLLSQWRDCHRIACSPSSSPLWQHTLRDWRPATRGAPITIPINHAKEIAFLLGDCDALSLMCSGSCHRERRSSEHKAFQPICFHRSPNKHPGNDVP